LKPRVLAAFALLALAAAPADRTRIDWVRIPGGTFLMGSDEHARFAG
jgi:formylglycine-generating enzyme required for sulfatase activity